MEENTNAPSGEQEAQQTQNADSSTAEPQLNAPDAGADTEEAKKPSQGVQKRIDELVRQRHDTERDRDYWREMAMRNAAQSQPVQEAPKAPEKPTLEKFSSFEEYTEAMAAFKAQEIVATREREAAVAASTRALDNGFVEKLAAFRATAPDYDSVVHKDLPISTDMAQAIKMSDIGPEIAYQLGKNPTEAARIHALTPLAQAMEIGRIESNLKMAKTRTTTKAPPPVSTLNGGDAGMDDSKLSTAEWIAKRNAEIAARRAGRQS